MYKNCVTNPDAPLDIAFFIFLKFFDSSESMDMKICPDLTFLESIQNLSLNLIALFELLIMNFSKCTKLLSVISITYII